MATEVKPALTWRLSDPGMDLLERAGLAALYMSLRAAAEMGHDLSPLEWEAPDLTPDSVTLRWQGEAKEGFTKLFKWAWQVGNEGVLYLPGVHRGATERENVHVRVPMHNGIFRAFLQHTNVQPKGESVTREVHLDEDQTITVTFQPPIIRTPKLKEGAKVAGKKPKGAISAVKELLKPWKDLGKLFDRKGELQSKPVSLPGWAMPGTAPRFATEQDWEGPASRAILLMLAPSVALFQRLQGKGGNWILVIPDVRDLEEFDETRRRLNLSHDFVDVASLGDAGLQFLAEYSTRSVRRESCAGCRVVAMGKVTYYQSQSIRKGVLDVPFNLKSVRRYQHLHSALPNVYVPYRAPERGQEPADAGEAEEGAQAAAEVRAAGRIKLPSARGRIADNLVTGRPWYTDLFTPLPWDLDVYWFSVNWKFAFGALAGDGFEASGVTL